MKFDEYGEIVDLETFPASKQEAEGWVGLLHDSHPSMALGILLGGDRWSCVDKVILAKVAGKNVGIATIASKGEQLSGESTIVAVYVVREHRHRGIGFELFKAAVDHMLSNGLEPIRVDVLNSKVTRMIEKLPEGKRVKLKVEDQSMGGTLDGMMES